MRDGRWITVTDSEFLHERRGLKEIRDRLRDANPWRAWSNFTFTAHSGHVREVDLLVVAPNGVHLVELKDWHGSVESHTGTWLQTQPGGRQIAHGNPLHLANKKAKELASLLAQNGVRVWVSEAVCFTDGSLRNRLPAHEQHGVHTISHLIATLEAAPRDERRRIDPAQSHAIAAALQRIGIARSDAEYHVGPYRLDRKAFDTGPTWADYLAHHTDLPEVARIRVYLRERGSDDAQRLSVDRAARREAAVLRRFRHPGVVHLKQYDASGHAAGPALIFDYHPETLRLNEYLVQYGDKLDVLSRMALVRQLAETMHSAHSRRIYHRSLAARAIQMIPRPRKPGSNGELARWLTPHLQIADWQIAVERGSGNSVPGNGERLAPTTFSRGGEHFADGVDAYLAPELTAPRADPVALDVYGLGVLTYLLATGRPPAASQAELMARFENGEGLLPSAIADGLSPDIDDLVQAATAYRVAARLDSVGEFLEMLELVEESLTEPAPVPPSPAPTPEQDPLDAVAGTVLADRWEVRRRLGTGSTSRAFLVRDLTASATTSGKSLAVLKVATSDRAGEILAREARVMGQLRPHSGIIRLIEPEPQRIGNRTVLVMEYVGDERESTAEQSGVPSRHRRREETVARLLRDDGRLSVDQLEAYGEYLFGAVDFLEGEGVWHRDLKPDNIAIRIRPNRTRELVLIDFSLAGHPANETDAGTEGYLDPFIGQLTERSGYDAHAERYALAVTLHAMASGELPTWGGGRVSPRQTDPEQEPYPAGIAADAFDPAVRDGLVRFFRTALHRDATRRFKDLKPMRDAWKRIFLEMDQAKPSSRRTLHGGLATGAVPGPGATDELPDEAATASAFPDEDSATAVEQRDAVAREVSRDTPLSASGLGPAAESFVYSLDVNTVGDLLAYSQRQLVNAPGLGARTRKEVLKRIKQWRELLSIPVAPPLTPEGRKAAKQELAELSTAEAEMTGADADASSADPAAERILRSVSLDTLTTLLVPVLKRDGSNRNECEMVRLLLRMPDAAGKVPDIGPWPIQKTVADELHVSSGRIAQLLKAQRGRWKRIPAVHVLRLEILELLHSLGRVASAAEIADTLAVRRGTELPGRDQRRALALAAVRAVVEVEQLVPEEAEFRHAPNRDAVDEGQAAGLLALEVGDDDAPETPSAPGLLDYSQRLGRVADRLARLDTLPTAATVLTELGAVAPPSDVVQWDERRIVGLAAAASRGAAATPRLEIYPRKLALVRALRLTQAGLVRVIPGVPNEQQPGLRPEEILDRVRTRFPEILGEDGGHQLPTGGPLTQKLKEAGFDLDLATRHGDGTLRYLSRDLDGGSELRTSDKPRKATGSGVLHRYVDDPQIATAVESEERLTASARRDGFRTLTVRTSQAVNAIRELCSNRFSSQQVSVTAMFLQALHEEVDPRPVPTWETILKADAAAPGTRPALKFAEYAGTAWGRVEPRVVALMSKATTPLLLVDAGAFARYDALGVLERLAELARAGGHGLWLLCPQNDPSLPPRLGTTVVPYQASLGEWIELPDAWVLNAHRADVGEVGAPL